jgi:hypothetical protein
MKNAGEYSTAKAQVEHRKFISIKVSTKGP